MKPNRFKSLDVTTSPPTEVIQHMPEDPYARLAEDIVCKAVADLSSGQTFRVASLIVQLSIVAAALKTSLGNLRQSSFHCSTQFFHLQHYSCSQIAPKHIISFKACVIFTVAQLA